MPIAAAELDDGADVMRRDETVEHFRLELSQPSAGSGS